MNKLTEAIVKRSLPEMREALDAISREIPEEKIPEEDRLILSKVRGILARLRGKKGMLCYYSLVYLAI